MATIALVGAASYFSAWQVWAAWHHREACQAQQTRDFRRAADHLERVLRVWPHDPAVHLLAARVARQQDDMDGASPHLVECTRQQVLAKAVALEYRLWQVQNGDLSDAPALLRRAEQEPESAEAPLILEALIEGCLRALAAFGSMGLSRTEVAAQPPLSWARRAVELWMERQSGHADHVQALVWRGRVHDIANEHAEAVADLRCAVQLAPDQYQPRWYLAASIGQEAPVEVAEHLAAILRHHPDNRRVRLLLASTQRGLGRFDEAQRLLDDLLAADPGDYAALLERGRLALDVEQPAAAEAWLRKAETIAPDRVDVNLHLSRTLQLLGRDAMAQRYLQRFQELDAADKRTREERVAKLKALQQSTGPK